MQGGGGIESGVGGNLDTKLTYMAEVGERVEGVDVLRICCPLSTYPCLTYSRFEAHMLPGGFSTEPIMPQHVFRLY